MINHVQDPQRTMHNIHNSKQKSSNKNNHGSKNDNGNDNNSYSKKLTKMLKNNSNNIQ